MRGIQLIIELNGLPGCGKSTVKQKIAAQNNEIKVIGVGEFRGENVSGFSKLLLKISRFLMQFLPANFGFYRKCRRLFAKPPVKEYCTSFFYEDTIAIMYMVYLFHSYRNFKSTILLADEGILQSIASACAVRGVSQASLVAVTEQLSTLDQNIIPVHCDCSIEESYRRIAARKRNDSAIDTLKGEQLTDYLCSYGEQLKVLREKLFDHNVSIHIDMCQTVDSQVDYIMERIKSVK